MPVTTPTESIEGKLVLVLLGAIIAWALKALWEEVTLRMRWRRLAPLILRQLADAGESCSQSFDTKGLSIAMSKLTSAQGYAIELVAAGVRVKEWLAGLERIIDCLDAARVVDSSSSEAKGAAIALLRGEGAKLLVWVQQMRRR